MSTEIQTKSWHGEIPVHYLYTYGVAGEKFFRELKERGVFVATRCEACNVTYLPPRIYCERCFAEISGKYIDVATQGTLETFTVCHEGVDGLPLARPQFLGFIRIDGTNGGIVHKISVIRQSDLKLNMKLEAVFEEPSKRIGAISDILHFRAC